MPPSPAQRHARLADALERVDAALAVPGPDWADMLANLGVWGAWLRWILQLLAFELALAGDEPCRLPGTVAETGAVRPLSRRALDRKIDRLIKAAERLWHADGRTSARPPRRRWPRRLLQRLLRWLASLFRDVRPAGVRVCRFRSGPVLALCRPGANLISGQVPTAIIAPARPASLAAAAVLRGRSRAVQRPGRRRKCLGGAAKRR